MKRYRFDEFIVVNASWWDVFKYAITRGSKGRIYRVIRNPPSSHYNCRCESVEKIK